LGGDRHFLSFSVILKRVKPPPRAPKRVQKWPFFINFHKFKKWQKSINEWKKNDTKNRKNDKNRKMTKNDKNRWSEKWQKTTKIEKWQKTTKIDDPKNDKKRQKSKHALFLVAKNVRWRSLMIIMMLKNKLILKLWTWLHLSSQ
jgi:hypothetical protein